MGLLIVCMGIVLWVAYRIRTGGEEQLIHDMTKAIICVVAVVVLLPILCYFGALFASMMYKAAMLLGVNPDVAGGVSFVALIMPFVIGIIVCALRLCHDADKAGTFTRSAHAKKESNVALRPSIDEGMEKLISKIAKDRADMAMSQRKSTLRRVSPGLDAPKTEGHEIDGEMEKLISKIAKDRADMAMRQRKSDLRRVSPDLSAPKTEGHEEVDK